MHNMEFVCSKKDLQAGVSIVERIVSTRSTLPIVGNILFEASRGGLKLSANNLEIGIEVNVAAKTIKEGSILIPAKTLGEVVAKLPDSETTFKLKDKVGIHKNEIESICRKYQPSLIIFDQIDKIAGFDADREDLRLGAIYIWARELAKNYAPVIGVCQSDGSGEGVRWLTMSNVANAKTSKQAEADWILGIGAIHDTGWEKVRFFHLSKNKLTGDPDSDPSKRHAKWEVLIKPEIARYADI